MKIKKNICIAINSLAMGGAEKQCLLLAKALKTFHNLVVVVVDPTEEIHPDRLDNLEKEAIDAVYLPKNQLLKITEFTRLLRKRKIEIVFSYLPTDTVLSAICAKLVKVPYKFGGIRNSFLPRFKLIVLRFVHNFLLNYTIANNYAGYQAAIAFGYKNRVLVIPNGIEIRPLLPKEYTSKRITIISLGRLVSQKKYDIAIQTIAHLKTILNKDYNIFYKIVGQGPQENAILDAINKYGLQKDIELIKDAPDIYALLEASDIYLCTSFFEGISNAIMEAMNCGLPIVATDVGDNSRLIMDNTSGYLVPVNDYEALANKLNELIESPIMRKKMGVAGHIHLAKNFGYKAYQKKYLDLIENIENIEIRNGEVFFEKERKLS
mgnify:CR=1 FL=1